MLFRSVGRSLQCNETENIPCAIAIHKIHTISCANIQTTWKKKTHLRRICYIFFSLFLSSKEQNAWTFRNPFGMDSKGNWKNKSKQRRGTEKNNRTQKYSKTERLLFLMQKSHAPNNKKLSVATHWQITWSQPFVRSTISCSIRVGVPVSIFFFCWLLLRLHSIPSIPVIVSFIQPFFFRRWYVSFVRYSQPNLAQLAYITIFAWHSVLIEKYTSSHEMYGKKEERKTVPHRSSDMFHVLWC